MRRVNLFICSLSLIIFLSVLTSCSLKPQQPIENPVSTLNTTSNTINSTIKSTTDSKKITITYPKNDVYWHIGDTVTITWTSENMPKDTSVTVMLWDAMMVTPYPIIKTTNTGSFKWIVTNSVVGAHLRLSVHMADIFSMNDNYINITP